MRKSVAVSLLAIVLLLVAAAPSHAWDGHRGGFHGHVFIGVGPFGPWWGPPYPSWYYPPPYYYSPPPVIVQEPPVYVQQQPPAPPAPPASWYYCPSAQAYYPNVETCPEAWVRVAPRPQ